MPARPVGMTDQQYAALIIDDAALCAQGKPTGKSPIVLQAARYDPSYRQFTPLRDSAPNLSPVLLAPIKAPWQASCDKFLTVRPSLNNNRHLHP